LIIVSASPQMTNHTQEAWSGYVNRLNFCWVPTISLEWLKLEWSNCVHG